MIRAGKWLVAAAVALAAAAWFLSAPPPPDPDLDLSAGDAEAGALVFHASGCASCHKAKDSEDADPPVLAGGKAFATDFGTFYAPNISADPDHGIGGWSDADLAHAIRAGVSPEGRYYYPAFPNHAYALMTDADLADLVAYLRGSPADPTPSVAHDVGFPFNIRRGLYAWRVLNGAPGYVGPDDSAEIARGRYLAEALGHCAECHTPRGFLGTLDTGNWMAGAALPTGDGKVPNITPAALTWSTNEIANYLKSGFTPEFDVVGGEMVDVVDNLSLLPEADVDAIAAYVSALTAAGD